MNAAGAGLRPLLALLQLASPALPVGGFAYSQGLEKAIEDGLVRDAETARGWIQDLLVLSLARFEAPMWNRLYDAWRARDVARFARWNDEYLSSRETAELRAETKQMGLSLVRVMPALGLEPPTCVPIAFPSAFAAASASLGVDRSAGLAAFLWAWAENQALVAVKTVPLGQMAGQALLAGLRQAIEACVRAADSCTDDNLGSAAVHAAIVCARHETMYSRLYRS